MKTTKTLFLLAVAATAVALAGCITTSIYPYYTEKDLIFDPGLVGKWAKSSESWTFEKKGDKAYTITLTSGEKTNTLQGHLFKLQGSKCLDLYSEEISSEDPIPPLPTHMLVRVVQVSPSLKFAHPSHDKIRQLLEENPKLTPHLVLNKEAKAEERRVVLSGTTAQLQKFVTRELKSAEFWDDTDQYERAQ
jgi:hypothetical protein